MRWKDLQYTLMSVSYFHCTLSIFTDSITLLSWFLIEKKYHKIYTLNSLTKYLCSKKNQLCELYFYEKTRQAWDIFGKNEKLQKNYEFISSLFLSLRQHLIVSS